MNYFDGRKRIGEVWICQNCGTEFPEYHNGCPKTKCDDAPRRGLVCVPIYESTDTKVEEKGMWRMGR